MVSNIFYLARLLNIYMLYIGILMWGCAIKDSQNNLASLQKYSYHVWGGHRFSSYTCCNMALSECLLCTLLEMKSKITRDAVAHMQESGAMMPLEPLPAGVCPPQLVVLVQQSQLILVHQMWLFLFTKEIYLLYSSIQLGFLLWVILKCS